VLSGPNLARVSCAPSNLTTYIESSQDYEKRTLGLDTKKTDMKRAVSVWEKKWQKMDQDKERKS